MFLLRFGGWLLIGLLLAQPAAAATLTVTSTGDEVDLNPGDGLCVTSLFTCTLRAAIMEANAHADASDTIAFAIPISDPNYVQSLGSPIPALNYRYWQIDAASPLPALAGGITLDGRTATASPAGNPSIWLRHAELSLVGANNRVFGLALSGNGGFGIRVGHAGIATSGSVLQGNWIGAQPPFGISADGFTHGVLVEGGAGHLASASLIGGAAASEGNVIAGHGCGISLLHASGIGIYGNRIGTNPQGGAELANGLGICAGAVTKPVQNLLLGGSLAGQGNLISGNSNGAVFISHTSQLSLLGNRIGSNPAGTLAIPNGGAGAVLLAPNSNGCSIGSATAGNDILGNSGDGLVFHCSSGSVRGNRIGLSAAGNLLGNGGHGIRIDELAVALDVELGGSGAGEGNRIAGNGGWGLRIAPPLNLAGSIRIVGNRIGGATLAAGNGLGGILVSADSAGEASPLALIRIGGLSSAERNEIAHNAGPGLEIAVRNAFRVDASNNAIGLLFEAGQWQAAGNAGPGLLIQSAAPLVGLHGFYSNRIAANTGSGILVQGSEAVESSGPNLVFNRIGESPDGQAMGNGVHGIRLVGRVRDSQIEGGRVAHNPGFGIALAGNASANNNWRAVETEGNAWAIDLGSEQALLNDDHPDPVSPLDDIDEGPNRLMNFPVIAGFALELPTLPLALRDGVITLSVPSHPDNAEYPLRIDVYASDAEGQGRWFLGHASYSAADYLGGSPVTLRFAVEFFDQLPPAAVAIVATATDRDGIGSSSGLSLPFALAASGESIFLDGFEPLLLRWE